MSGMEVAEIVNPFEELGIPQTSGPEEVRKAYHLKAKLVHPDQFQDAEQQAEANRKMVRLNQAYEEAMGMKPEDISLAVDVLLTSTTVSLSRASFSYSLKTLGKSSYFIE